MKMLVIGLALALSVSAQEKSTTKKTTSTKSNSKTQSKTAQPKVKAAGPKPTPSGGTPPPAGATQVNTTDWKWTDPKTSKTWVYRRSPMGWVRIPEEMNRSAEKATVNNLKAVEQGDTVLLTRTTPVGVKQWSKKRSELTPEEQAAVEAAHQEKK
jgi:hypothetical protein